MKQRYTNGRIVATDDPFTETREQLGVIMILEARDLNQAVEPISQPPGATFGPCKIRPATILTEIVRHTAARRRLAGSLTG